jgi:hypothetical protein
MKFTRTVVAGALLIALSSLASPANARAADPHAVAVARSKLIAKCTIAEEGCIDASSSPYAVWDKRALPKFGEDGDALAGADAGEGASGAAGIEGVTAGAASDSGETAEVGGVGGGKTSDSDSDTGAAAADAGVPSSDDGSVDTSSSEGSQSTSDDQFPQGQANQPVVDIVARGYTSGAQIAKDGTIIVKVGAPGLTGGPVDTLQVDTEANSVGVQWAINDLDTIANNPSKVPLRSIIADTWKAYGVDHGGKQMGDLSSINYQTVVNVEMQAAFPAAYEAEGLTFVAGTRVPLTVASGTDAFNVFTTTTFFNGAQKMLAETAGLEGRIINSIDLFPTATIDVRFNF